MSHYFDRIAKTLAGGVSRRQALWRLGGVMAGAFGLGQLARGGPSVAACNAYCNRFPSPSATATLNCRTTCLNCPTTAQMTGTTIQTQACSVDNGTFACTYNTGNCTLNCSSGYANCANNPVTSGCTTHISADPSNCGSCGTVCSSNNMATTTCGNGVCNGTCASGYANCDNNLQSNGCETNISNNTTNCGACGTVCPSGQTCSNGACLSSFQFRASQVIDGQTVTCSNVINTGTYTECDNFQANGLYMPNGITCGPTWSTTNSAYSDTQGLCQSLTGSTNFEAYYTCNSTLARAAWHNHVWSTFNDNGYTQNLRCYYS